MNLETLSNKSFFEKTTINITQIPFIRTHADSSQEKEQAPEISVLVKSLKKNSNLSIIRRFEVRDMILNNGDLTRND